MIDKLVIGLRNPVGRALAIVAMKRATTTSLLKLAFMTHGDRCSKEVAEVGDMMTIIGMAIDMDKTVDRTDPRSRKIAGAVSACANMIKVDRFDSRQLAAVEQGANAALEMVDKVQPKLLLQAALIFQAKTNRRVGVTLRGSA